MAVAVNDQPQVMYRPPMTYFSSELLVVMYAIEDKMTVNCLLYNNQILFAC